MSLSHLSRRHREHTWSSPPLARWEVSLLTCEVAMSMCAWNNSLWRVSPATVTKEDREWWGRSQIPGNPSLYLNMGRAIFMRTGPGKPCQSGPESWSSGPSVIALSLLLRVWMTTGRGR